MLNTMYDLKFKDYIKKYKNVNKEEWITLYQRKKENDIESNVKNDIFTFCAMIDVPDIKETNYLKDFSWGFTPYSFGTIDFGTQGVAAGAGCPRITGDSCPRFAENGVHRQF